MKKLAIVSLLLIASLLAGCQSKPVTGENISVAGGSYKNVTAKELNTILKNKDFVFIMYIFLLREISQEQIYPFPMTRLSRTWPNYLLRKMPKLCCTAAVDA